MNKTIGVIITSVFLISCGSQGKNNLEEFFRIPTITQEPTSDTIEYFRLEYISHSWPIFITKSKFCDTLDLTVRRKKDTTIYQDFLNDGYVNTNDTLKTDGFEIYPDYRSNVSRKKPFKEKGNFYYPVYLVNQTPTTKIFIGKDNYVFAIQEALDSNHRWRPIEGRGFDFCGNGYWGLKIHSNEFAIFLMPKYQGNYTTKLRVRLKCGNNIYVSDSFEGQMNYTQFFLDTADNFHYTNLVEKRSYAIQNLFYGAQPLEVDNEDFGIDSNVAK